MIRRTFHVLLCVSVLMLSLGYLATPGCSVAQLNSATGSVIITAPLIESITVLPLPVSLDFSLLGTGTILGSTPIVITTVWVLSPTRTTIKLYGYFTSASAALTDGASHNIPSSAVLGSVNSGTYTAFTGNSPFATGSSLQIFSQSVSGLTLDSLRIDTLSLQISTTGLSLPSGIYLGTLVLQAQAT